MIRAISTPIFEWYVVKYGSENQHQKDMRVIKIGLCAQNMLPILSSILNMCWGDLYDYVITTRAFTLIIMNKTL